MTTIIVSDAAQSSGLAERAARWAALVVAVAIIAGLAAIAFQAIDAQAMAASNGASLCSTGGAALSGGRVELARGWASCAAPAGVDPQFGRTGAGD